MPIFSIIIPTYNRAKSLQKCLQSLVEQTFKDFEVIVSDDGSIDNSKQVVESFNSVLNIKYLWQKNWGGPARPRNLAINKSNGEWLCFLDSDDWFYPNKLEMVSQYISSSDFIFHKLEYYDKLYEKVSTSKNKIPKQPIFNALLYNGNYFPNSSVVVKKEIVISAGGFSEDKELISVEDFDLWLKIFRKPHVIKFINQCLGGYYIGGDNLSEHSEKQINHLKALYKKNIPLLSPGDRQNAQASLNYFIGIHLLRMKEMERARQSFLYTIQKSSICSFKIKAGIRYILSYLNKRGY